MQYIQYVTLHCFHFFVCQCNEVKGSTHMELEGLKRGVNFLEERGIAVESIITDRHVQVRKYMRVDNPEKTHLFDVFHVAKGKTCICRKNSKTSIYLVFLEKWKYRMGDIHYNVFC